MTAWRLVCDVGGTHVRFARGRRDGSVAERRSFRLRDFPSFSGAARAYLEQSGGVAGCTAITVGAAGPVDRGSVRLTNAPWVIDAAEIRSQFEVPCVLVNDVEAAALCLPHLSAADYVPLGSAAPDLGSAHRLLAANSGTGFGAATLIKCGERWLSCPSEAGHMTFPPPGPQLGAEFKSVEHVLSGIGLAKLYGYLAGKAPLLEPAEVFNCRDEDPACGRAVSLFTRTFGDVLGNLTLAVAAWDGAFLFGSVAAAFARIVDVGAFRSAFESKGAMRERMQAVPTALVVKEDAALVGLAALDHPEIEWPAAS